MSSGLLPKARTGDEKDALARIIESLVALGMTDQADLRANWLRNYHFVRGARKFPLIDRRTGKVEAVYQNDKGEIEFQLMDAHAKLRDEVGRLMQLDTRPAAKKSRITLDGMRGAAISQAVLDYLVSKEEADKLKTAALQLIGKYGTCGMVTWSEKELGADGFRFLPTVEVVPPWELIPVPVGVKSSSKVQGVMRTRRVSLEWLQGRCTVTPSMEEKMKVDEIPYGQEISTDVPGESVTGPDSVVRNTLASATMGSGEVKPPIKKITRLCEVWLEGPRGTCSRYVVWAGGVVVEDHDYEAEATERAKRIGKVITPVMMPIAVANWMPTDQFFSPSLIDMLFSPTVWAERMCAKLFQHAEDADALGLVLVPGTWGVSMRELQRKDGLRFGTYEPDPSIPEAKLQHVAPADTGTLPQAIAQFAMGLGDKLLGQPSEMLSGQAPGRVDSSTGLNTLVATSNIPLNYAAGQIAQMFGAIYRSILSMVRGTWSQAELIEVGSVDEALIGLKIDPKTMQISLTDNAVPDPRDIEVTIRAMIPVDQEKRVNDLWLSLQNQQVTASEFRWIVFKENLPVPIGNRADIEARRKAILHTILLFNDGQTPGQINYDQEANNPQVFLEVLDGFMCSVEFSLAAVPVKEGFYQLKDTLRGGLATMPSQLPYPEELAQQGQGQPAQGGGMPPGMGQMGGGQMGGGGQDLGGMNPDLMQQLMAVR